MMLFSDERKEAGSQEEAAWLDKKGLSLISASHILSFVSYQAGSMSPIIPAQQSHAARVGTEGVIL
jgi:hypothetical protein